MLPSNALTSLTYYYFIFLNVINKNIKNYIYIYSFVHHKYLKSTCIKYRSPANHFFILLAYTNPFDCFITEDYGKAKTNRLNKSGG